MTDNPEFEAWWLEVGESLTKHEVGLKDLMQCAYEAPKPTKSQIVGCCCPPKHFKGLWAGALCPVHFGLNRIGVKP